MTRVRSPVETGGASEGAVLAELLRRGKRVLTPVLAGARYDLLVDDGDRFVRIQVKTGRLERGAVVFQPCSVHITWDGRARARRRGYRGDCELFAVYCATFNRCYFVPVDAVGTRAAALRITPTRNGQSKHVRWARDFEEFPPCRPTASASTSVP